MAVRVGTGHFWIRPAIVAGSRKYAAASYLRPLTKSFTMRFICLLLLICGALPGTAQTSAPEAPTYTRWQISPILGIQSWATYTIGQEEFEPTLNAFAPVDDRLNFMVRRLRFGSTANITDRLFFKFLGAADFVGSDQRAGTVGGVNNGAFPNLQVWDLYLRYQLSPNSEAAYVVGGFLRPPVGRESMSGAYGVASFEKSFSQFYVRQQMTGTGPGGTGGAYFGGLGKVSDKFTVDYRAGLFNPFNNGISAGQRASTLVAGRVNFMFGDPESQQWRYGLKTNYFGKRRGVSIAVAGSREGDTGILAESATLGVDWLVNFGQFHLEGEYIRLLREGAIGVTYNTATYFVRAGYNFALAERPGKPRQYVELAALAYGFDGATDNNNAALATAFFSGDELAIDVGLNYHVVPGKVKLALHYVARSGDHGNIVGDASTGNQYFFQPGIGGIRRGDYLGFGVVVSR